MMSNNMAASDVVNDSLSLKADVDAQVSAEQQQQQQLNSRNGRRTNLPECVPDDDDPDVFDSFCDPDAPKILQLADVTSAADTIRDGIVRTACDRSRMCNLFGMEIYLKKETQQFTGNFKERGARFALENLTKEQKQRGVIASSTGSHSSAISYHGQQLNIPVYVVMPTIAPLTKINKCIQYGAKIILMGNHLGDARKVALKIAKAEGLVYVNGYDHPDIIAGQGTVGLEILEQMSKCDAVIVPIGGAGLIAGISVAVKTKSPNTMIIGVEAEKCPCFTNALTAGKPVYTNVGSSVADGLASPTVGLNSFYSCHHLVDRMITVSEEAIALSVLRFLEMEKMIVEGAGAAGLAAVLEGKLPELQGKTVCIVISGGNIDTTALFRVIERGLAADGRLIRFVTTVSDRPGGIAELSAMLAGLGVSIKDIFHERAWLKSDIYQVNVRCVCEVRDREQGEEMIARLRERYGNVDVS